MHLKRSTLPPPQVQHPSAWAPLRPVTVAVSPQDSLLLEGRLSALGPRERNGETAQVNVSFKRDTAPGSACSVTRSRLTSLASDSHCQENCSGTGTSGLAPSSACQTKETEEHQKERQYLRARCRTQAQAAVLFSTLTASTAALMRWLSRSSADAFDGALLGAGLAGIAPRWLWMLMMMLVLLLSESLPLLLPSGAGGIGPSGAGCGAAEAAPTGAGCGAGGWGSRGIIGAVAEGWLLLGKQGEARER